jgi:hypothetical protein
MSPERFATHAPARLEWHPAHEDLAGSDLDTFLLHVEFVHAHGVPKGEFTTFSIAGIAARVDPDAEGSDRARGK